MSLKKIINDKPAVGWLIFALSMAVVFGLGLLASSITERRLEGEYLNAQKRPIAKLEPRNEVWGENYPREFESYYETKDTTFRSKHGGGAMIDMLEEDPRLVILWAGYGFSKDYNQGRGHAYAIDDIQNSLRTGGPLNENEGPMPATCWTCKSPDVPRLMNELGVEEFYKGKWARHGAEIVNPIGCADCHDEKSMDLKITRPALIEAFEAQGKDISKASHQEMRSLVCAQCHVEYYFDKKLPGKEGTPYLKFPWRDGMTVDDMEKYYDEIDFSDWTHKLSRAPMLKTQHPDYELFTEGIHGQRGVSCADCHMPYKSEGGQKFTDHKLQSPLNNVANSCQVCHRESEGSLIKSVYERQDKIIETRNELEKMLVRAHIEAKTAWDNGATEKQMEPILKAIRHAQWRWDFTAASHGGSFHAPVEMGRIVATGMDRVLDARVRLARLLSKLGVGDVAYPNIQTKALAQKYIGMDLKKLEAEKEKFKEELLPKWIEEAQKREATYDEKFYQSK
ncbi:ammonia-forming cytochrome c nitrite reductase [Flammeovirga pectinis]|uniref:Cytochrome c-552 n=1 Tax=Flammeovirga pectinis TaxID=2494373 RepID=A0A3S9P3Z2_9BACT|nr:ammonia-forming cytochrome c nitrite reductase [Flammeovirga pectinis]AZQ62921.1 ammonia-forming cytochrome c nitrite reductase [Flammeovirga pectinis]